MLSFLDKAENNSYFKTATEGLKPSSLNFSNGSRWSVSSLRIDYAHSDAFLEF